MATDEVRYGVIGTGMMGREHIFNIQAIEGTRVVALSDPVAESLELATTLTGLDDVRTYADHRELLDDGGVDAVVVASPNMTHIDVLTDVLASGVSVLVEKPLCTTVADCRTVIDAANESPGITWVGLEYRYMPPVTRLVEQVEAGVVGDVKMIAIREHRFPFLVKVGDWNRFNRNSGGTLVEKCCHFFDLMNLIAGRTPVRVMGSGAQDVNHLDEVYGGEVSDILDNAFVIVDYEDGKRALLDLAMFAEASQWQEELAVTGDLGKVEAFVPGLIPAPHPSGMIRIGSRADMTVAEEVTHDHRVKYEGLHHGSSYLEHLDFLEAVRTGSAPAVSLEDGLMSVAMGVAAHRSIDERRVVEMTEVL